MSFETLGFWDLAAAASLVLVLGVLSWRLSLGLERSLAIAAARTTAQLLLVGIVLRFVFSQSGPWWVIAMALVMLSVAGYEVTARQRHRFTGGWSYGLGTGSMLVSGFSVTLFALWVVVQPAPWYTPQYAIPLLGMLLGNAMTSIALATDRLLEAAVQERVAIEAQLALGYPARRAMSAPRRNAMRVGMIPMINAMAAAGVVSLPGMMTGQILAGTPPMEAVKYQIMIMFLITGATGFGAVLGVIGAQRRLFDRRDRLRLDRLRERAP